MNTTIRRSIAVAIALAVIGGLIFAFVEGRAELAREREREKPVAPPSRTTRSPTGESIVELDAGTLARVGITAEPLTEVTRASEVKAFGTILDPTPLAALYGELIAAEAAAANSAAQLARTKALFAEDQNASRRAFEAAEAQARTDGARRLNAEQRWRLALGDAGMTLREPAREAFIEKLVHQEALLANVELPPGEPRIEPGEARVTGTGEDGPFILTRNIHAAPSVDARTRGQAFLLVLDRGNGDLRPGSAVTAFLTRSGASQRGVVLPATAVVRAAGLPWAYVQSDERAFTRRPVTDATPTMDGWFVSRGFEAGERVVVRGAQVLLSEELKSQISVGEEAEKE